MKKAFSQEQTALDRGVVVDAVANTFFTIVGTVLVFACTLLLLYHLDDLGWLS